MKDLNISILVVDDRESNRRALQTTLSPLNVEIIEADSGEAALREVLHHSFSVILMDVNMLGLNGCETAEIIANYQKDNVVPIIFLTAKDHYSESSKLYTDGVVDYIVKPYDPEVLLAKVRVFIQLYIQQYRVKKALADAIVLRDRSELLIESAGQGLMVIDNDFNIVFVNKMACTLLNSHAGGLTGKSIVPFVHPELTEDWLQSPIYTALRYKHNLKMDDAIFLTSQKRQLSVEYTMAVVITEGAIDGAVILFKDITERKLAAEKMAHFAQYDQLTGIYNRRMFQTLLEESLSHAKRFQSQIALHFLDLDRFKAVNDTLGHDAGDALLKEAVNRIKSVLRDVDIVARLGGDEFGIIQRIDDCSGFSAASLAQRIIDSFSVGFQLGADTMYVGCSIGIAQYPTHAENAGCLVKAADTAMYNVKESGRNDYRFFNDKLQERLKEHMSMVVELKTALQNNELYMCYQPQVDAETNQLIGVEGLMRWHHPVLGEIGPAIFIPIAEKMGLINKIGDWCLREVVSQAVIWNQPEDAFIPVSINISAHQIMAKNFVKSVCEVLRKADLDPRLLKLELTESVLMDDPEYCIVQLNKLDALGVHTAIDDFGTGYSSLNYLGILPAKYLKIDKSFVINIHRYSRNQKIVKSIMGLAKSLDLQVIAEGVETKEELDFLMAIGCNQIQGYYYSEPLSVAELNAYISRTIAPLSDDHIEDHIEDQSNLVGHYDPGQSKIIGIAR
ncbi:MAG: EAL domain-containing protein [Pseudomonadales bacterium]|nr:EAL domain-containing protein [Pseudomonadales bacterium]